MIRNFNTSSLFDKEDKNLNFDISGEVDGEDDFSKNYISVENAVKSINQPVEEINMNVNVKRLCLYQQIRRSHQLKAWRFPKV